MDQKLLNNWKKRPIHRGELFISDGIIDKSIWDASKVKSLFLLKEAYDSEPNEDWDLCDLIKNEWKGPKYKLWWTVSQWAYGISQIKEGNFPPFTEDRDLLKHALFSSAVINIKKSGGNSKSDDSDLILYLESDWDLIEKQIIEVNPDIVVCGNTWSLIERKIQNPEKISDLVYSAMGFHFVDFWHPANFYPNKLNYYSLCATVSLAGIMANK